MSIISVEFSLAFFSLINLTVVVLFLFTTICFQVKHLDTLLKGQPCTPSSLPLSVRTNSDLIHCSSTATIGRSSAQFQSDKHSSKLLGVVDTLNFMRSLCLKHICQSEPGRIKIFIA